MYTISIIEDYVRINCCEKFRPPFVLFHKSYLPLVNIIVNHLNEVDPNGDLVHKAKIPKEIDNADGHCSLPETENA